MVLLLVLQLALTAVAALPLLLSSSVWLSWSAAALSVLICLAVIVRAVQTVPPAVQWMLTLLSTMLWVLPLCLGVTYVGAPERGWHAVLRVWPLAGAFGSMIVLIALLGPGGAGRERSGK